MRVVAALLRYLYVSQSQALQICKVHQKWRVHKNLARNQLNLLSLIVFIFQVLPVFGVLVHVSTNTSHRSE